MYLKAPSAGLRLDVLLPIPPLDDVVFKPLGCSRGASRAETVADSEVAVTHRALCALMFLVRSTQITVNQNISAARLTPVRFPGQHAAHCLVSVIRDGGLYSVEAPQGAFVGFYCQLGYTDRCDRTHTNTHFRNPCLRLVDSLSKCICPSIHPSISCLCLLFAQRTFRSIPWGGHFRRVTSSEPERKVTSKWCLQQSRLFHFSVSPPHPALITLCF